MGSDYVSSVAEQDQQNKQDDEALLIDSSDEDIEDLDENGELVVGGKKFKEIAVTPLLSLTH